MGQEVAVLPNGPDTKDTRLVFCMTNEIQIRLADFSDSTDCDAFLYLLNYYANTPIGGGTSLPSEVMERIVGRWANHAGSFTLLAWDGRNPAGMANCVTSFSTFRAQPRINIHDLVVHADYEGRGIGRSLIEAVINEAKQRHACQVSLEVRADNTRARGLYQRMGFEGTLTSDSEKTTFFGLKQIE